MRGQESRTALCELLCVVEWSERGKVPMYSLFIFGGGYVEGRSGRV
jgi:hypothetical protein